MNEKHFRIAYLIDDLSYGGAQKQLSMLVEALPERFVPLIFCLSESTQPFGDIISRRNIRVFSFRRRSHYDLARLFGITRALANARVDIVHGFLSASNAYSFLAGRMLRKPIVLTLRSSRLALGGFRKKLLHAMLRQSGRVMVNSKAGEAYLVRAGGVPREKIVLIRNWFKMDPALQKQLEYGSKPASVQAETVGYAGRLSKVKRLDLLIRAFAGVIMSRPDANLVLLGSGPERHDLEDLVEALDLKEKVSFHEPVIDVMRVMRHFSCLVLPSAFEGLPNAAIEALALGIPIVSSAVGDMAEIVSNGKTGFLLKEVTPEALADRILEVLTDTSFAENARLEGPKLVAERFAMQAALEKLIPMYEDLLRANQRGGFSMGA